MPAIDLFPNEAGRSPNTAGRQPITSPSSYYAVVSPSDSADLVYVSRGLYVGGAGNITVIDMDGNSVLFTAVPAGTILPIRAARVMSTGTTATAIVALA